ncbi:MAG: penicillin-binding protein [Candidatus Omnitrophica bacterium]|nr:penicillin-binding protein [Candidatus Omnitrophota bacterium]
MQIRKYPFRFSIVFLFLLGLLIFFAVHLVFIQIFRSAYLTHLARRQHEQVIELEPVRGTIFDRNKRPLAFNIAVYSLFANPRVMSEANKQSAVMNLSPLLNMSPAEISGQLAKDRYFVWLYRKMSSDVVEKIKAWRIPGLGFQKESKRYYPGGPLAAHVIGFAGIDNEGLEGLELAFNRRLKGEPGWMNVRRDARQRQLMLDPEFLPPQDGMNLVLTIDETIQYLTEQALAKGAEKHHAAAASMIVVDVKTGEVLALANVPTYDLANAASSSTESRTNRAISFMNEPGSVFKIVTAAAALEEGGVKEEDKVYCENGEYRVANHILHDHTRHGFITFRQVIEVSSNIGTTKIAQKIGPDLVYKYAKRYRFGELTGIDLKGEVAGVIKPVAQWSKTSIGAVPIGQEVTVTPIQLLGAIAAVANDGVYMKPYVVKAVKDKYDQVIEAFGPRELGRVMSVETAKRLREILRGVVEEGTAKTARIDGVSVGGKTGTAQKVVGGTYSHDKFYASFIGFAPVENPRLAAVVVFDEPHPSYYGGTVAAPVFKEVMENALKYLSVVDAGKVNETPKTP